MKYAFVVVALFLSCATSVMAQGADGADAAKRFQERNRLMFEKQRQDKLKREQGLVQERKDQEQKSKGTEEHRETHGDQVSR